MTTDINLPARNASGRKTRSLARPLPTAARVLMGLIFFVSGLNGFLNFIPMNTPMPAGAVAFSVAMMKTGYLMPLVAGTELITGILLLANRFVPLALALIAPVVVNIVAFHAFLAPSGLALAVVVAALEVFLAWSSRAAYRPMLAARATPGAD